MITEEHNAGLQPDTDEVLQRETDVPVAPVVPVHIVGANGPTRTQALPNHGGATFTKQIPASGAAPVKVLTKDSRRAVATIVATGGAMRVSFTEAGAQGVGSSYAVWPAGVLLPIRAAVDVWVTADTVAVSVSVVTELWAAGEGSP